MTYPQKISNFSSLRQYFLHEFLCVRIIYILINNAVYDAAPLKNMNKENFHPQTPEEILAFGIASGLNDLDHLQLFIKICRNYPRDVLLKIFQEVKAMPDWRIRKTRGALYTYMVRRYAENNYDNLKDYCENQYEK